MARQAHQEVEAVSTDWIGIVSEHQTSLLGVEEGGQPENEGGMLGPVAAFPAQMVAGVQQLVLEVGEVDEALVRQGAAAPQALPKLILLRILQSSLT